jgi:hypothetical protein
MAGSVSQASGTGRTLNNNVEEPGAGGLTLLVEVTP